MLDSYYCSYAIVLHQMIRMSIKQLGYVCAIKKIAEEIAPLYIAKDKTHSIRLNRKGIQRVIDYIIRADCDGDIVASCISVSALAHLLCTMARIDSCIVIGVCLVNEKVYSHAWVELIDGSTLCPPYDDYHYKPIKKFTFFDLFRSPQ